MLATIGSSRLWEETMERSSLALSVTEVQYQAPVAILHAEGQLDRYTYQELIAKTKELYRAGQRNLILDLRDVTGVRLTGLYALLSTGLLFEGEEPPAPELGAQTIRYMADHLDRYPHRHVKLLSPPPAAKAALAQAGFEIHANLPAALVSFLN
jgi:hypothetical protein